MIRIIGAGFSGLSLAYHFVKLGVPVTVVEKQIKPGGIIESKNVNGMHVESAANGLLASEKIEKLFEDIGIKPLETRKESRKKYIFRQGLRRWPLSLDESLILVIKGLKACITGTLRPFKDETLASWGQRVLGSAGANYLLQPMVNGIFANKAERLDAKMVLDSLFYKRIKGQKRGLLTAASGMGQLIEEMHKYLSKNGVHFEYEKKELLDIKSLQHNTFLACNFLSVKSASMQNKIEQSLMENKLNPQALSVIRVTLNFKSSVEEIDGFGVLFPNVEKFNALGVLANSKIFDQRGEYNESWIFSDSTQPDLMSLSDKDILQKIESDRKRIFKSNFEIKDYFIYRWPNGIPSYNAELSVFLKQNYDLLPRLAGNYLGVLGLAGIHERNFSIANDYYQKNKDTI